MKMTFNVSKQWLLSRLADFESQGINPNHGSLKVEVDTDYQSSGINNPQGEVASREVVGTVRAKMVCSEMVTYAGGGTKVKLGAVYSSDPNSENRAFSDATPSGSCEMMIQGGRPAIKLFEAGAEYYVDFVKVQKT